MLRKPPVLNANLRNQHNPTNGMGNNVKHGSKPSYRKKTSHSPVCSLKATETRVRGYEDTQRL